jgi:hypothetical protein
MVAELQKKQKNLYEADFVRWVETTVQQLQNRDYDRVDWTNLIEEIEDMSRRERKALKSNLIVILLHLLKWQYQSELRSGSWNGSICEHRRRVNDDLQDSPSLVSYVSEIVQPCYDNARKQAEAETGLPISSFPLDCCYTIEQILNPEFLPA